MVLFVLFGLEGKRLKEVNVWGGFTGVVQESLNPKPRVHSPGLHE